MKPSNTYIFTTIQLLLHAFM